MRKLLFPLFVAWLPLSVVAQCTQTVDSDNYSSSSAWTATGAGNVTVSGGACTWNGAQCSIYDRVYRPLAATLSDTYFKAEFKFTVQQNPAGQGGGSDLISFCAGSLDPLSYDNSQSYAATNQDGLTILISSSSTSDNNINNWALTTYSKDGTTGTSGANTFALSSSISTYYAVFERTSTTQTVLTVYSDAAHTVQLGQASNSISANITGLNYVHHGVTTWGWNTRYFNGTLDDLVICDDLTGIIPVANDNTIGMVVYPNPSADGHFTVEVAETMEAGTLFVYDALGQAVLQTRFDSSTRRIEMDLAPGIYFLSVSDGNKRNSMKVIVE